MTARAGRRRLRFRPDADRRPGTSTSYADGGQLKLSLGASQLAIDGAPVDVGDESEYARLYRRFAELIDRRECDVDLSPFHHVADAFLLGRRTIVRPFEENPGRDEDRKSGEAR